MIRRIDLLPAAYAERRRQNRIRAVGVLVIAVVAFGLFAYSLYLGSQVSDARSELEAIQSRNQVLQGQIAELQRFADLDAEVKSKKTALVTVFAGDIDWPAIMTEIAMVVPGEVWLESFVASAGDTEGAAQVPTETNAIRLTRQIAAGRITFDGNSASCMPGVAKWLIRLATVDEFDAAWLSSATEPDVQPGCDPPVAFASSLEMNDKALSHRFEGDLE